MKILYIGAGFVGACSAAVSANSGHDVLVFDINEKRIEMLGSKDRDIIEACLFEEGLGDLIVRNEKRILFTNDYTQVESFLHEVDVIFLCLPTPEIGTTGESDLSYYDKATNQLAQALAKRNEGKQTKRVILVNKSTVPIDMVDHTQKILDKYGIQNGSVVSNPEFLVEGKAVRDSLKPDRIVVGAWEEEDFVIMRKVYRRFYDAPTVTYIEVNPREAAAGKLLANFYLMTKLMMCFDVFGRSCEHFDDVNFENVRKILTTDDRIGNWGFYDSLYAGGSCLIKDVRSLSHQLEEKNVEIPLLKEIYSANKRQLFHFLDRAEKEVHFSWAGKTVALLGVAFKRDTNDIRNSPSKEIIEYLNGKDVKCVNVYDPAALPNFQELFLESSSLHYFEDVQHAVENVDAVIIATDWPEFRELAHIFLTNKNGSLIMDGRRMLSHDYKRLKEHGYNIIAVGSQAIQ